MLRVRRNSLCHFFRRTLHRRRAYAVLLFVGRIEILEENQTKIGKAVNTEGDFRGSVTIFIEDFREKS